MRRGKALYENPRQEEVRPAALGSALQRNLGVRLAAEAAVWYSPPPLKRIPEQLVSAPWFYSAVFQIHLYAKRTDEASTYHQVTALLYTEVSCYLLIYASLIRQRCDAVAFCTPVKTAINSHQFPWYIYFPTSFFSNPKFHFLKSAWSSSAGFFGDVKACSLALTSAARCYLGRFVALLATFNQAAVILSIPFHLCLLPL